MSAPSGIPPSAVASARPQREVSRTKSFHQAFLDVKSGAFNQPSECQQIGLEVKFPELYRRALQRVYATRLVEGNDAGDDSSNGGDGGGAATTAAAALSSGAPSAAASTASKGRFAGIASRMKLQESSPPPVAVAAMAAESIDIGCAHPAAVGGADGKSQRPPQPQQPPQFPHGSMEAAATDEEEKDSAPALLVAADDDADDDGNGGVALITNSAVSTGSRIMAAGAENGGGDIGGGGGGLNFMTLLKGVYDKGGHIDDAEEGQQQPAAAESGTAAAVADPRATDLKKALKEYMDGSKAQMDEAMNGPIKQFMKQKGNDGKAAGACSATAASGGDGGDGGGGSLGGRFFASVKAAAQESLKEARGFAAPNDGGEDDRGEEEEEEAVEEAEEEAEEKGDDDADGESGDDGIDGEGEADGKGGKVKDAQQAEEGAPRRVPGGAGGGGWGRVQAFRNGPKGAPKLLEKAAAAAGRGGGVLAAAMEPQSVVQGKEPWLPSGLSPHQVALRARARDLVLEHVLPYSAKWDEQRTLPRRLFAAAGRAGFCAMVAPLLAGGRGWSAADAVAVFEVLGAADLNSAALLAHQNAVTWIAGKSAGPLHKLPLTAALGSGLAAGSCAASEPQQAGPHRIDLTACFAVKYKDMSGDYWIINGLKDRVPLYGSADVYLVAARTDPGADGLSLFLLPKVYPGLTFLGPPADSLGARSLTYGSLALTCCIVRDEMRVVSGKKVLTVVKAAEDRFRLFLASAAVGSAAGAVALAQEWVSERQHHHFSHDLLSYQALQHRLVGLTSRVAAARLAVQSAAAALDSLDKSAPARIALAKRYCVSKALSVLEAVRTMFGAASVHVSYPLVRVRRNLISYQVLGGDMELCVEMAWTGLVSKSSRREEEN